MWPAAVIRGGRPSRQSPPTKAMDVIAGFGPLTPTAEKPRRLLHYGQIVQSHALHFFYLASPDLLLGFESEVAKRNIIGVAAAFPDLAVQGVMTRKFGQQVIAHIAGKRIHGTGVIPGGVNKPLSVADRNSMRAGIDQIVDWSKAAVGLVIQLHETSPEFYHQAIWPDANQSARDPYRRVARRPSLAQRTDDRFEQHHRIHFRPREEDRTLDPHDDVARLPFSGPRRRERGSPERRQT